MNKNKLTLKNVDVEVKLLSGSLRKCSKIHGFYAGVQKKRRGATNVHSDRTQTDTAIGRLF